MQLSSSHCPAKAVIAALRKIWAVWMDRKQVIVWENTSLTEVSDSSLGHFRYCHMLLNTF